MQAFIVSMIFFFEALMCTYLASLGFRGVATSTTEGYGEDIGPWGPSPPDLAVRRHRR
jgi:HJR/Mrr/RecB family endonuclease